MPIPTTVRGLLLTSALAVAALTGCDATQGPATAPATESRQVTVVGQGQVQGTPDTLTANVSMESVAADATTALNETSQRQRAVIDALHGQGVADEDISTTQVSLQPQFGDNSTIQNYRASNTIDVKIRQTENASQILGQIAEVGGDDTRINSVNYSIEDDSALVRDARNRAFNDAKARAEQYAELAGMTLGPVMSISEAGTSTPPVPAPMPRAAMEAVPLEPGQQTVGFSVTVVWELS